MIDFFIDDTIEIINSHYIVYPDVHVSIQTHKKKTVSKLRRLLLFQDLCVLVLSRFRILYN